MSLSAYLDLQLFQLPSQERPLPEPYFLAHLLLHPVQLYHSLGPRLLFLSQSFHCRSLCVVESSQVLFRRISGCNQTQPRHVAVQKRSVSSSSENVSLITLTSETRLLEVIALIPVLGAPETLRHLITNEPCFKIVSGPLLLNLVELPDRRVYSFDASAVLIDYNLRLSLLGESIEGLPELEISIFGQISIILSGVVETVEQSRPVRCGPEPQAHLIQQNVTDQLQLTFMISTALLHFRHPDTLEAEARVLDVRTDQTLVLNFDITPFFPQGGGQPSDQGCVQSKNGSAVVKKVVSQSDKVDHICCLEKGKLQIGQKVVLKVDKQKRCWHNRLHSAGHLVDAALQVLKIDLKPGKAYHYEDGPYVQYDGVTTLSKDQLARRVEQVCIDLIKKDLPVKYLLQNEDQMDFKCFRSIQIGDFKPIPCGGTHVTRTSQVGIFSIRKVQIKKGRTKVSYKVEK